MGKNGDKIVCFTPTPGQKPTRIDAGKYDAVRMERVPGVKPQHVRRPS